MDEPHFPGTQPPERRAQVESFGLQLNVLEWGDPAAPAVVLTHGMWDHARSFAAFAPLLAKHFRVIALDARGHGDSQRAGSYTWLMDVQDVVNVLRWIGRPSYLVGHSKGGGQATDAAMWVPELVRKLVNIDGFGPPPFGETEVATPAKFVEFLTQHRNPRDAWRPYPTIEDLVERRSAQNPRLSLEWLRYFAFHGARQDADGWRWKSDPWMGVFFGPWCPEWIGPAYQRLRCPMLAVIGSEPDTWGPLPESVLAPRLAYVPVLERRTIAGAGHFVHIERPLETAAVVEAFLRS